MILAPKLERALERLAGFEQLLACDRLSAGASRETYRLTVRRNASERKLALRRAEGEGASPMGSGPGLSAEAKLFAAARQAGVPGPEVLLVLQPEDELGAGFVMEWISGETLGGKIARGAEFAEARKTLAKQCGEILARLHAVDVKVSGLDQVLETFTPEHSVRKTHAAYLELGSPQPMIDFTARWLLANLPSARPLKLVHSDFRNGNLIVDPATGVVAVLDWELAHVGDPMRDLGWLVTRSWRFGAPDKPVGGFGELDDLIAGYESASGEKVDRDAVRFWEVFGSFWWAVGTLSMGQSFRNGSETSLERPAIGRRSSECQVDLVPNTRAHDRIGWKY
jgi:aminoglycoside phosphotransferase (APT) family kinase protein